MSDEAARAIYSKAGLGHSVTLGERPAWKDALWRRRCK